MYVRLVEDTEHKLKQTNKKRFLTQRSVFMTIYLLC